MQKPQQFCFEWHVQIGAFYQQVNFDSVMIDQIARGQYLCMSAVSAAEAA